MFWSLQWAGDALCTLNTCSSPAHMWSRAAWTLCMQLVCSFLSVSLFPTVCSGFSKQSGSLTPQVKSVVIDQTSSDWMSERVWQLTTAVMHSGFGLESPSSKHTQHMAAGLPLPVTLQIACDAQDYLHCIRLSCLTDWEPQDLWGQTMRTCRAK